MLGVPFTPYSRMGTVFSVNQLAILGTRMLVFGMCAARAEGLMHGISQPITL